MQIHDATLVTCCMNREAHLRQSLPRWLALPFVRQIVIVDWSNARPLLDLADLDDRILVVRALDEPRWVLSYAFNLAISHASEDIIIKADADAAPNPAIAAFLPDAKVFYAGHWQRGKAAGKDSINGQCIFTRAQFQRVNGYSELMRIWGRDDEDFYERLTQAGYLRGEIPPDALDMIAHTDAERLENQKPAAAASPVDEFLGRQLLYWETQNRVIGAFMKWGPQFPRAQFVTLETTARTRVVRRRLDLEIPLPPRIQAEARLIATRVVIHHLTGRARASCDQLDQDACGNVLAQWLSRGS